MRMRWTQTLTSLNIEFTYDCFYTLTLTFVL
jgi:hypothetical protein